MKTNLHYKFRFMIALTALVLSSSSLSFTAYAGCSPPPCAITGNLLYCAGSTTQICALAGSPGYLWNTGATTQCITVTAGDYTVTVTDANFCTSSCTVKVTERPNPVCSITGNNFCNGNSEQMCASAAPVGYTYGYSWSTGATTQCITNTVGGTYTVTITDQYGCSSTCTKTIITYTPPTCSITGSDFCYGYSRQLCASTNSAYLWSTGATTQCITTTTGGTYTVTVSDINGCTNSCSKTVIAYTPPDCAITGNFVYCNGSNTLICAPAGLAGYLWNTGATTQCITVTSGYYTVTVTDANGCTSSCSADVNTTPLCSITGAGSLCSAPSTQWCAASPPVGYTYTYLWSTAETTQCITLSSAGAYTVTITDQNGCTNSCAKALGNGTTPTCSVTGNGSICPGYSTQWCTPAGLSSYLWNTGATTQCIVVNSAITYTATVTHATGCTSSCSKSLTINTPPTCAITGNLSYCPGSNTQICGPAGLAGYLWNTGATTQCITVTAGDYTITVTDAHGCTTSCSAVVNVGSNITVDAGPNKIVYRGYADSSCTRLQSSGISGGTPPLTLTWSNGSHAAFINVCPTTTTTYYLTVSDVTGCSRTDSVKVCVIDVRCGNNLKSVVICHGTGSASNPFVTLCLDKNSARWHFLNHTGEQLGPCGLVKSCLFPVETRTVMLDDRELTEGVEYLGAFPNPFSNSTTIRFSLPEDDFVGVKIFDVTGRLVENLYEGETASGEVYSVEFDGSRFTNGIYFLVLTSQSGIMQTRKLILDK